jgi:uncharacterized protein
VCGPPRADCGGSIDRPVSALESAASQCSNKVLAYLLKSRNIRHRRDAINRSLFLAQGLVYLEGFMSIRKTYGMADTVGMLLEHGAGVKMRNRKGETPMLYGIHQIGHEESVKALRFLPVYQLLLRAGADINAQNASGQTALMVGAAGAEWLYGYLLYHGADPNKRDKMGRTALMYNARERDEMDQLAMDRIGGVQLLLRYGADPSMRDKEGKTAYDIAKATASQTVPVHLYDPSERSRAGTRRR